RRVQGDQLRDEQTADDRNAQRLAQFGTDAGTQGQRQGAEHRGEGGHQERPKAQQGGTTDRIMRGHALALRIDGEVDHHDRVFLDDADQQDDADDAVDGQAEAEQAQRQQGTDAGRRQGRYDREGVDVALVQYAEHDVDDDQRGEDQQYLVGQRCREFGRLADVVAADPARHADTTFDFGDRRHRIGQRMARGDIERDRHRGKLVLVTDHER